MYYYQAEKDGIIDKFESLREIAKWLRENNYTIAKDNHSIYLHINQCIKKERERAYSFYWTKIEIEDEYKFCLFCNKVLIDKKNNKILEKSKNNRKFCNHSCSASYSNKNHKKKRIF